MADIEKKGKTKIQKFEFLEKELFRWNKKPFS